MIHIFFPLSEARRNKAEKALLSANEVRIGLCGLRCKSEQIWGINLSGNHLLLSATATAESARQAVAWAERQQAIAA